MVKFGEGEGKVPLDAIAEGAKKYQPKPKITYKMIQEYAEKKYGFKVHTVYIAPPEVHESFGDKVLRAVDAVKEFSEKHPVLTGIVKWAAAAAIATAAVANNNSGGGRSSGNGGSDYSSSDLFDDYSDQADDNDDDYGDSSGSRDYPDERSSPREHDVSGYDRQQNGKTVCPLGVSERRCSRNEHSNSKSMSELFHRSDCACQKL